MRRGTPGGFRQLRRAHFFLDRGDTQSAELALRDLPESAGAHVAWGHLRLLQRCPRQALEHYGAAISMGLQFRSCANERWMCWMLLGDFEQAWRISDQLAGAVRALRGLEGKHIHVRCDHGLGDSIQFARYLPLLRQHAASVSIGVQPDLEPLVPGAPRQEGAIELESMELPYLFRTTVETIPSAVPYLSVPTSAVESWAARNAGGGFRVGLVWASGPWNPARSVLLAELDELHAIEGARFYSLQHGPEWCQALQPGLKLRFANDPQPANDSVVETAAAILNLHLVVTVDTMVAHLAGALGRPVITLLPYAADWRWMLGRADSPWYPSMRLLRQSTPGSWRDVVRALEEEMTAICVPFGTCS